MMEHISYLRECLRCREVFLIFHLLAPFLSLWNLFTVFGMPVMLLCCGAILSRGIRIGRILHPGRFRHTLMEGCAGTGTSPWKAMTMALAGTLGVGNITGVSAAVLQGGVGAVFWMWIGALFSMAVKYGEVALAVRYHRKTPDGKRCGGMMYVIRDGLTKKLGNTTAYCLGGFFSLLCLANALITGTIVQSNAAADVLYPFPEWASGLLLAILTVAALLYGIEKVGDITLRLVPGMTAVFILLSLWIILGNLALIPSILRQIVTEAFSFRALGGGITGIGIRGFFRLLGGSGFGCSLRYGITRGIFSNEAGCGTSPSAHASAETRSPFHQGCMGIFEVICDTLLLCTMTALVLCIGDRYYGFLTAGGNNLTLRTYQAFGGDIVYGIMAGMVMLFAYATILAQMYYGSTAIGYFTVRKWSGAVYAVITLICIITGAILPSGIMWGLADFIITLMTCINTAVLFGMRREIMETVPDEIRLKTEKDR